jgi:hypothetical protein
VEVRVAAVDDRVARLEVLEQLLDLRLGGVAGGDHDPDRARGASAATSSSIVNAATAPSAAISSVFSGVRL